MTPAGYVERPPAFTAVEWDGSSEAATWITGNFPGATYDGTSLTVRDSMDRESALGEGSWIVRNDTTSTVFEMAAEDFGRRFQPVE